MSRNSASNAGQSAVPRGRQAAEPDDEAGVSAPPHLGSDLDFNVTEDRLAERVARRAADLTSAAYAVVLMREDGVEPPRFLPRATVGVPLAAVAAIDAAAAASTFAVSLNESGGPVRRSQILLGPFTTPLRAIVPEGFPQVASFIAGALVDVRGAAIGYLLLGDPRPEAFDSKHERLIVALAEQAGIAIQNSRLYAASQRALRESETLRFIGQQLAGQIDVTALLNQLVRHARTMLDADIVAVSAADPSGDAWRAGVGFESDQYARTGYLPGGVAAEATALRRPVVVDLMEQTDDAVLAADGIRMALGVPLLVDGTPSGALVAGYRRPVIITDHEIALMQALASHASISAENARLLAEAEARAAEAEAERRLLRAVLESMPVGIVIAAAPHGTITHVNPAAEQLIGAPSPGASITDVLRAAQVYQPGGDAPSEGSSLVERAITRAQTVAGVEVEARGPDGQRRPLLINAAPVIAGDGRPMAGVLAMQDVSHLKEVQRLKDEFLSVASHELKTPLTPLLGLTQLLLRGLERGRIPPPEQLAGNLRTVQRQALHMSELVDDLLDVSRIQQGRLELYREPCNIIALAADVLERMESMQPPERRHHLRLQTTEHAITGLWDRRRLDQVVTNLVSNAIKYSPAGSEVLTRIARVPEGVRVSVSDHGIGIPVAEQSKLFEPFYRARNASVRNYPGVGLGLHITREIVQRHGGSITVESAEGEGSTFTVLLPLEPPASPDDRSTPSA